MQKGKEKVTMKAIAEEAGVTLTTVSRILNHKGDKYADSTKQKIFDIADRLKYRPNALVLGMQSGTTHTAGVMIPTDSQFYAQIVAGVHSVFLEHNTIMLLGWNPQSKHDKDDLQERHILHQLIDRRVDGIILRPGSEECERSYFEEIWERDIPFITVDREMTETTTDFVGNDDTAIGQAAAEHLLSLGHRRLLFVGEGAAVSTSRRREYGFRKVLSESGGASCTAIDCNQEIVGESVPQLLDAADRPTAIFCYNDPMAESVGEIAIESGLSIPNDIALIGCGNQASGSFPVSITTFDQQPQTVGQTAAQLYLERVAGSTEDGLRRELIASNLVARNSTAAPHT